MGLIQMILSHTSRLWTIKAHFALLLVVMATGNSCVDILAGCFEKAQSNQRDLRVYHAGFAQPASKIQEVKLPTLQHPPVDSMIEGQVFRVIDGDTIILEISGKRKIFQLLGANTHEMKPNGSRSSAHAVAAKRFTTRFLSGESVYIQHDSLGMHDGSDRWTGYVYRTPDMACVNLELIRQGYARFSDGHVQTHAPVMKFYEQRARSLEKGIWNPDSDGEDSPVPENDLVIDNEKKTQVDSITENTERDIDPHDHPAKTVYVTKHGTRYHREDCRHVRENGLAVERESLESGLKPCKTCRPDGQETDT